MKETQVPVEVWHDRSKPLYQITKFSFAPTNEVNDHKALKSCMKSVSHKPIKSYLTVINHIEGSSTRKYCVSRRQKWKKR